MRRLLVIGIGAGDPEQVTVQAIRALNETDVFFVFAKTGEREELVRLRHEILERYVEDPSAHATVEIPDAERDRGAEDYGEAVEAWRRDRGGRFEQAVRDALPDGGTGAVLVWGDPALYDSTLAVIDHVLSRGELELAVEVIPGISSVQALAARHGIPLNRVGGAIQITTGRRLASGLPEGADDVVVMLDANCAFRELEDTGDVDIYWGAYIGTEDELLVAGDVRDVGDEIARVREEARDRKGWIMDTYLLRRAR